MVIPTPDPVSAISSSISATIKILEVTYQLKAVDEQTADLLATTRHVDFMLQHAHRLRRLKTAVLNANERTMIDTIISDTEDALRAVAKLVEPCRVDKTTKKAIRFGHRVMWVFRDNPSIRDKHQKLQVCHQSLATVFSCLYSKDLVVIAPITERRSEDEPPPYDSEIKELLNWQKRRKGRRSVGERESPADESLSLTTGGPDVIPVAGPSSSCLLAIQLEDDGGTSSLSTGTEMSFEPSGIPPSDTQPSVFPNKDKPLSPATASSENQSSPSQVNAQNSFTCDDIGTTPPTAHTNARHDYISPINYLPQIDSSPFATMIAPYNLKNDEEDALQVDREDCAHTAISAWNQASNTSAATLDTIKSAISLLPSLPSSTVATSASSKLSIGDGLWMRSLESSIHNSNGSLGPTTPGQYPLGEKINSDVQSSNTYQLDHLDAIARVEDVISKGNRALSVGQGRLKRGGRSWLAYHATRSDMGQDIGWDG